MGSAFVKTVVMVLFAYCCALTYVIVKLTDNVKWVWRQAHDTDEGPAWIGGELNVLFTVGAIGALVLIIAFFMDRQSRNAASSPPAAPPR